MNKANVFLKSQMYFLNEIFVKFNFVKFFESKNHKKKKTSAHLQF